MSKRVNLQLDLPDEVILAFPGDKLTAKAKEAFVMELLKERHISEGTAAHTLNLNRKALLSLMAKYHIPVIDMTAAELDEELDKPLPL